MTDHDSNRELELCRSREQRMTDERNEALSLNGQKAQVIAVLMPLVQQAYFDGWRAACPSEDIHADPWWDWPDSRTYEALQRVRRMLGLPCKPGDS